MPRKLTDKQKAWCHAYVGPAKFNASAAAEYAGISDSSGREMRTKPAVMAYADSLMADNLARWGVSQERTLLELAAVAFSSMADFVEMDGGKLIVRDWDEIPNHVKSAVKKIKLRRVSRGEDEFDEVLELELHDKLTAVKQLGEYQGLFKGQGDQAEQWGGIGIIEPPQTEAAE